MEQIIDKGIKTGFNLVFFSELAIRWFALERTSSNDRAFGRSSSRTSSAAFETGAPGCDFY
ncbi:MAG: hypothetical protein H6680_07425 [Desulfobacteraceae bacterium]|nr:hypothetical protein [Desulfobacteraceae bacterium]